MTALLLTSLAALAALAPLCAVATLEQERPPLFWVALAVATAGVGGLLGGRGADLWRPSFSDALWITIFACLLAFAAASIVAAARKLTPIVAPYLFALGAAATLWADQPASHRGPIDMAQPALLHLHVAVSVAGYALLTLAGLTAVAVLIQARALKARRPTRLSRRLPAVTEGDRLQYRLMTASAVALALGLATGLAKNHLAGAALLKFDHKTLLTLLACCIVGGLAALHRFGGVRGRAGARAAVAAHLALTFGFPGVKFVTDVVLG